MRAASFLRMTNCNTFAGRFPCPIPWAWKMGSIFDSHAVRLSNLGDKIWSLDAVEWKMPPVFDSWPGRGYDLGGPFYPSDHPEHRIWGSVLPFRPPRASNLGVIFAFPAARKSNLGGQIGSPTSRKANLGGRIRPAASRKANLGVESDFLPVLPQKSLLTIW